MKIKDCVVIELNLLKSLLDDFNKCMIENGNSKVERQIINNHIVVINKIINKSKPLKPIIKDAYNAGCAYTVGSHELMQQTNKDLNQYLNETEI